MRDALLMRALALAERVPHLGIGPDLYLMTAADLWGVCRFLSRVAHGA